VIEGLLLTALALACAWLLLVAILWLHRPSRQLAGPALRLLPGLVRLVRALIADPATPRPVRLALGALIAYYALPFDLIPDFLPGVGVIDDVALTILVLRWAARRVGVARLRTHWTGTDEEFAVLRRLAGFPRP
jgi:uncharacterized membrane protein YkvA (DUF1232 family)